MACYRQLSYETQKLPFGGGVQCFFAPQDSWQKSKWVFAAANLAEAARIQAKRNSMLV
jgi:hypothetical protein